MRAVQLRFNSSPEQGASGLIWCSRRGLCFFSLAILRCRKQRALEIAEMSRELSVIGRMFFGLGQGV